MSEIGLQARAAGLAPSVAGACCREAAGRESAVLLHRGNILCKKPPPCKVQAPVETCCLCAL